MEKQQWKTYIIERNTLTRMIFASKTEILCEKVVQFRRKIKDMNKLYAIAYSVYGIVKQNPQPESMSEQPQADASADYFLQKIIN